MLSGLTNPNVLLAGLILAGVQFLAALPWLYAVDPKSFGRAGRTASGWLSLLGGLLAGGAVFAAFLGYKGESAALETNGKYVYGSVLHLQLIVDLALLLPVVVGFVWPKGGAVASAAYREGWRQPLFWLILTLGVGFIAVSVVIPYYTFGDDYKMMKQIGFDVVMLAAVLFGVLAASWSISEEIEGRTAVTLMSKPVNRRQFLVGKFLGTLMACLVMSLVLAWTLNFALRAMREFDQINNAPDPSDPANARFDAVVDPLTIEAQKYVVPAFERAVPSAPGRAVARGAGLWFGDTLAHTLGVLLGFGQVMILVAIASALATRIPYVVNLVLCLVIYLLGHLAPEVVRVTELGGPNASAGVGLVGFLGRLFDAVLPALEFFNMGPAIVRDSPLEFGPFTLYVLTVFGYSILYTSIALLVGLLLFEDRDLA